MEVKCLRCGKLMKWEDNPLRPFCSERCKLADLSDWLDERYKVAGNEPPPKEPKDSEGKKENQQ